MAPSNQKAFDVTHRSVLAIAWPTTLAYLSTPLLGLVDTGVVGRLGDAALLGGLAIGAILFDIIFTTLNFLRSSTTGLVAQAQGAGDDDEQRTVLIRSLLLAVVFGVFVLFLSPIILSAGLWAMGVSDNIQKATSQYFAIRILAAPLTLINFSVLGWMLGQANAKLGLFLQLVLNGTNIAFSIYLGLHLEWGIEGVAWATVIAECVTAVVGLLIAWRSFQGSQLPKWSTIVDTTSLRRLFGLNRDIMIRSFCLLFAFAFFTAQGARFGENTLAANAVLMNFFMIAGFFLDGFATAAEQLVGKAIGAQHRPAFDNAVRLTLIWGFILAGIATLMFWVAGPWLIDLLTTNETVRAEAREYLIWAALTAIVGVAAFQMDGVYIGATWSSDMRNMMLLSLIVFLLTWFVASALIGNHGLWIALLVFLGARGITLYLKLEGKARQTFIPLQSS